MTTIREADLSSRAFRANPYPLYARLRAEAPVCRMRLANKQYAWLVTRYDDVVSVLKDDRFVSDGKTVMTPEQAARQPWVPKAFKPLVRNLLNLDPPDHTRLRGLVHKAFTPRLIEGMRARIERLTDEFLSAAIARGRLELIGDYALPLPTTVIAEMLGVPAKDRHKFHRWSSAILATSSSLWGTLKALPHVTAFMRYIRAAGQGPAGQPAR